MRIKLAVVTLLGVSVAAAGGPALAQGQIGRAAAVVPQAQGTPPQQAARVLQIGLDMVQNERVQTGPEGRAQLLFVDGTALTVGPNSDVVLDEYVYDPAAGSGKIALSATRGVFRIVGGKISKGEPVTLRTPTVTIGVRGGVAFANVGETVSAAFVYGDEMTATGSGGTERTTRNGTEIVTPPSGVPNPPRPLSEGTISSSLNAMEGAPGASAGPAVGDEDVAQSQLAELGSAAAPEVADPGPVVGAPTDAAAIEKTADKVIASQIAMAEQASGDGGLLTGPLVGRYKTSAVPGVEDGTGDDSPSFNIPFTGGSISGGQFRATTASSLLTFPVNPDANGMFSFSPSDATGSAFGPLTGAGWVSAARDFGFIEYFEDDFPGFRGIAFFGVPTPAAAFAPGVMSYALRDDFVLGGSKIPFFPQSLNGDLGSGGKLFVNWAATPSEHSPFLGGSLVISGQGPSQRWAASLLVGEAVRDEPTAPFLEGQVRGATRRTAGAALAAFLQGGIASSDAGDGSDFFGSQADFVLEGLRVDGADVPVDPLNLIGVSVIEGGIESARIFPNAISTRLPAATPATRTSRSLFFETAGIVQDVFSGPTVMHRRFGTNESTPGALTLDAANGTVGGFASLISLDGGFGANTFVRFGEPTGGVQESAFVNDKLWGATESGNPSQDGGTNAPFVGAIVSSGMVSLVNVLPMGVSVCACQYVDWGFWSGQMNSAGVRREFALIPFTAGAPVVAGQFPGTGSAVYSGNAVANFYDGSSNFIAAGGLNLTANFLSGSVSLTANITNLNGNNLTYTGAASAPGPVPLSLSVATGPANFLLGDGAARFAGPGAPPENVYGHFAAQDMTGINRVAGVLMGQR